MRSAWSAHSIHVNLSYCANITVSVIREQLKDGRRGVSGSTESAHMRTVSVSFLLATLICDLFCFGCNVAVIIICRERHCAVKMIRFCSRCAVTVRCCCIKGNCNTGSDEGTRPCHWASSFSRLLEGSKCLHLQGQFDCLTLKAVQSFETSGITQPTTYFWRLESPYETLLVYFLGAYITPFAGGGEKKH